MAKEWSEFEKRIDLTNKYYARKGIGCLSKIPNGTKTIRIGGKPVIIPSEKTGCDFIGHINGVPVAYDAKSTVNKTAFPIYSHGKPMLKVHQEKFLREFEQTGGKSYLFIKFKGVSDVFFIPLNKYLQLRDEALESNRKSINISEFEQWRVELNGNYYEYAKEVVK